MRSLEENEADWSKIIKERDEANLQYRRAKDNLASDVNARVFKAARDKLNKIIKRMRLLLDEHEEILNKQDE